MAVELSAVSPTAVPDAVSWSAPLSVGTYCLYVNRRDVHDHLSAVKLEARRTELKAALPGTPSCICKLIASYVAGDRFHPMLAEFSIDSKDGKITVFGDAIFQYELPFEVVDRDGWSWNALVPLAWSRRWDEWKGAVYRKQGLVLMVSECNRTFPTVPPGRAERWLMETQRLPEVLAAVLLLGLAMLLYLAICVFG